MAHKLEYSLPDPLQRKFADPCPRTSIFLYILKNIWAIPHSAEGLLWAQCLGDHTVLASNLRLPNAEFVLQLNLSAEKKNPLL